MARSLVHYYNTLFWINYVFYWIYIAIKYPVAFILWRILRKADKTKHKEANKAKSNDADEATSTEADEAKSNEAEKAKSEADKPRCKDPSRATRTCTIAKMMISMRWLILQLFGGPLGIVERREDEYKPDTKNENDIPTLYIRNNRVTYQGTMVLCVIIVSFGILSLSSAIDLSLLKITHVCSEDPHIDCYPQLITNANDTLVNLLNITINTDEPILDCAFWNSEGVSSQVTFDCFQFVYNVEVFLATLGGLSTAFLTTMKISAGVLLWLCGCTEKRCMDKNDCSIKGCKIKNHCSLKCIRKILISITTLIELLLGLTCTIIGSTGVLVDNEGNSPTLRFIAMHAVDVLIVFGVVANLLWLPWEEYGEKPISDKNSCDQTV